MRQMQALENQAASRIEKNQKKHNNCRHFIYSRALPQIAILADSAAAIAF
jgi:hypothetical protein